MLNKTFRLFVSSTFRDFTEERNYLNNDIYNRLNDFCRSKGYYFQIIDLRWGVNTEAALNQNTLSICLDEVRRCKELSPRPNFLVMAGDRFGWVPLPQTLSRDDFFAAKQSCTAQDGQLLDAWYRFDANAVPEEDFFNAHPELNDNLEKKVILSSMIFGNFKAYTYYQKENPDSVIKGIQTLSDVLNYIVF